jgi:hypothetical protein
MVPANVEETKPKVEESTMVYFDRLRQDIQMGNEKAAAKIHEQSRFFGNMWLKRTGWAKHLRAFDREWLYNTTREPDGEPDGKPDGESDGERVNGKNTEEKKSGEKALE